MRYDRIQKGHPYFSMVLNKPLKVLLLTSSYPRSEEDSASVFLRHLAEGLSRRGIKVHVLAPAGREQGPRVEGEIHVHRFPYFPGRLQQLAYGSGILPNLKQNPLLWLEVPFFVASMIYAVFRLLCKERLDLIHAHWVLPPGLIAVGAKLFYKIPVVTTAHGADAFALQSWPFRAVKSFVLRRSDAWTANTNATAGAVGSEDSLPKLRIIPMGVDLGRFAGGQREKLRRELKRDELLILFVGRLVEKKGVGSLLSALALLSPEQLRQVSLWIVGDGECRSSLEKQAQSLGIGDKVRFWGRVSNHLLPDFYAAADLFVAPSIEAASGDTEGQGVVFLEAFAARLCVLSTRVGGIGEVIEDGRTGTLVQPNNPPALADAMATLLETPSLRGALAENAFLKVQKHYPWEKVARDFEELYREVLVA